MRGSTLGGEQFLMRERFDRDRALRLALSGEIDLSVGPTLADRLAEAKDGGIRGAGLSRAPLVHRPRRRARADHDGLGSLG
jgi:hypothetical protein